MNTSPLLPIHALQQSEQSLLHNTSYIEAKKHRTGYQYTWLHKRKVTNTFMFTRGSHVKRKRMQQLSALWNRIAQQYNLCLSLWAKYIQDCDVHDPTDSSQYFVHQILYDSVQSVSCYRQKDAFVGLGKRKRHQQSLSITWIAPVPGLSNKEYFHIYRFHDLNYDTQWNHLHPYTSDLYLIYQGTLNCDCTDGRLMGMLLDDGTLLSRDRIFLPLFLVFLRWIYTDTWGYFRWILDTLS